MAMTPEEMINVISAYKCGRDIEWRIKDDGAWCKCASRGPTWDFSRNDYRAMPPRVVRYGRIDVVAGGGIKESTHFGGHNGSPNNNLKLTFRGEELIEAEVL